MLKLFIIMAIESFFNPFSTAFWLIFTPLIIWEFIWKAIGLWKSARNNQLVWFIVILFVNTLGILPIVYILFFQKKKK